MNIIRNHTGNFVSFTSAEFNKDGSLIVSAISDGKIQIWDAILVDCLKVILGHTGYIYTIAFNNKGSMIVSASKYKTIHIWDAKSGECP